MDLWMRITVGVLLVLVGLGAYQHIKSSIRRGDW